LASSDDYLSTYWGLSARNQLSRLFSLT